MDKQSISELKRLPLSAKVVSLFPWKISLALAGRATTGQHQGAPAYQHAQQEQRGDTETILDTIDKRQEADRLESTLVYMTLLRDGEVHLARR